MSHFLHFTLLFATTRPGGCETYCLQTVVAVAECYFHSRDTVVSEVGMVAAVGVVLRTLVGAESRIALCWCCLLRSIPRIHLYHMGVIFVVIPCLIPGCHTCVPRHVGFGECDRWDWRLGMRCLGDQHHTHM